MELNQKNKYMDTPVESNTETENILSKVKDLERLVNYLSDRIYENEILVNKLDQYSRCENVEIHGIPDNIGIKDLENNLTIDPEENLVTNNIVHQLYESPKIKEGIKLPKSAGEWELANSYFKTSLLVNEINQGNLDESAKKLNETIYNYFRDTYGTINNDTESVKMFKEKYKNYFKKKS